MLDDLKMIHERDAQDALGVAEKQWQQLTYEYEVQTGTDNQIDNIVYAGMGGSALAAQLSTTWPGYGIPFEVCRTYNLPQYVNERTLVIAASYSGNTEETLSAVQDAASRNAQVVVIAGGGKLAEFANSNGYTLLALPKAEQPRYAVFYNLKAIVAILTSYGFLDSKEIESELLDAQEFLKEQSSKWAVTVKTSENPAKKLAQECVGKSMVVYAGPQMFPAAYKWKISFNENAKNVAWCGQIPEFNHNEFIGWSSHPTDKPYKVIDLRSSFEHERVQKRFEVSERLLSGLRPAPEIVEVQGDTLLKQLLWATTFGDFVTIYTGLLNGVNPTPVPLVEKFKKELG